MKRVPSQTHTQALTPEDQTAITLGASVPLGAGINERVTIGFGIFAPLAHTLRGEMLSPQAPQFYRYQNRPQRFVGLSGIGIKITEWISVGVGAQLFADLIGRVQIDLRLSDRHITAQSARVDFPLKLTPTAGLLLGPFEHLRLGFSWRKGTELRFEIPSSIMLDEIAELEFQVGGVVLYTPDTYNLGVSFEPARIGMVASAGITWARWSSAPDPSLRIAVDAKGRLIDAIGAEERLDLQGSRDVALSFRDIWIIRLGIEQRFLDNWLIRGGYTARPGPAPTPTSAYNYIDSNSHRFGAGLGFEWLVPNSHTNRAVSLDLGYSATVIAQLKVTKAAGPNDPVGDFDAGGIVHSLNLNFRHRF